jgi:cell wall assembly regulator SMI1
VRTIEELINVVVAGHGHELASPDAAQRLDAFEKRTGCELPADLRAFYTRIGRAELRDCFQLLSIEEFRRTGAALQGDEWADSEPVSWYAFCEVDNGDFVGIDLEASSLGEHRVLDCDHENVSSRRVIARSFSDFLERALSFENGRYYLAAEPMATIEVPYRPPLGWLRRHYVKWSLDPEVGPRSCAVDSCSRLCVSLTVHCRRHHFEAINGLPYPFEEEY